MPKPKLKDCKNPACDKQFQQFNSTQKYCSAGCFHACETIVYKPRQAIRQVSEKRKAENKSYSQLRLEYLSDPQNAVCFIRGCNRIANTIEHTKGRKGYADDWAKENKITLYLDVRFWKPCCLQHNLELENNPELSREYQLSKIHDGGKSQR